MNLVDKLVIELNLFHLLVESSSPLPTIHFQSLLDSNDTWTSVTRTLCEQVCEGQIYSDSIDVNTVDQQYTSKLKINRMKRFPINHLFFFHQEIVGFSDIHLAVIIGSIKSSLGLHPWLTRLTEFM